MNKLATNNFSLSNDPFIDCWNQILAPKWGRFRHLLSAGGKTYSDIACHDFDFQLGNKILDVGCGFGESSLEIAQQVGNQGEVLGIDCTEAFLNIAEQERQHASIENISYIMGDAQQYPLPTAYFDIAFSRFGVMFFASAVQALRNMHQALKPGGKLCLIVWRTIADNPCWHDAKQIALQYLPPPEGGITCGPGPFSMANEETTRAMLAAAGFTDVSLFKRADADICVGNSLEEAIDFQTMVGPAGEIIREAGELGKQKLSIVRQAIAKHMRQFQTDSGIYMPSSCWLIMAHK